METLEQLNGFTSAEFRSWLETRLRQQHSSDDTIRYYAFDFRELGVVRGESCLDDIQGLFKKLSLPAKKALQEAVCELLRTANVGSFPLDAMSDLIVFVLMVNAVQALDFFISAVAQGEWGKKHKSLIFMCASVMLSFDRKEEAAQLEQMLR